jgi:molybdenum cofactor cytidylyltransferase
MTEFAPAVVVPAILAGGDSTRMGYPKALLPLGTGVFLTRILDTIGEAGLTDTVVVLGNAASLIKSAVAAYAFRCVINPDPSRGQLSSIQMALSSLASAVDGCMVWPVDQPAVSTEVVRGLAELFTKTRAPIVAPLCAEKRGHPVIFGRSVFNELLVASPESGAKSVVLRRRHETELLPTTDTSTIIDIDTPEDYFKLTGKTLESVLKRR